MPGGVAFKHFDFTTAGIPDVSWTWRSRTVWLEIKAPGGVVRAAQDVVMKRLASNGLSYYVLYDGLVGTPGPSPHKQVRVVHPRLGVVATLSGHKDVAEFIKKEIEKCFP